MVGGDEEAAAAAAAAAAKALFIAEWIDSFSLGLWPEVISFVSFLFRLSIEAKYCLCLAKGEIDIDCGLVDLAMLILLLLVLLLCSNSFVDDEDFSFLTKFESSLIFLHRFESSSSSSFDISSNCIRRG